MNLRLSTWTGWRIDALGAAGCLALTLAVGLGAVLPLHQQHQAALARKADLEGQQAALDKAQATLSSYQCQLEAVRRALAQCPMRLEPTAHVNRRLAEISALAGAGKLKLEEILPGKAAAATHYQTVPISLTGSGTYRNCTAFLRALRKTFPDVSVSWLEMTASGIDAVGSGLFRFQLQWHAALGAGKT